MRKEQMAALKSLSMFLIMNRFSGSVNTLGNGMWMEKKLILRSTRKEKKNIMTKKKII